MMNMTAAAFALPPRLTPQSFMLTTHGVRVAAPAVAQTDTRCLAHACY